MGLLGKLFAQKSTKKEEYPAVPDGMKGVFMKGIGMYWMYGCMPLVEGAIKRLDGVQDLKVEIPPKDQVFVVYNPDRINPDVIKRSIIEIGYDVKEVVETGWRL